MPINIQMPKLDRIMTQGTIMRWLKNDGEGVEKGEILAEIETEKTTAEIESPASGIFYQIRPAGSVAVVGETIAIIVQPGEGKPQTLEAREIGERVRASPLAKRLSKKYSIDLASIHGTGPDGFITKKDVLSHREMVAVPERREALEEVIPLIGWRKTMANRMSHSMRTTAHITTIAEVDVTELVELRENLKDANTQISYSAFVVKAVLQALREYPIINSSLVNNKIVIKKYYNIGVAVAREEKGLIVVVIHDADKKNLTEISTNLEELVEKARQNKLSLKDVTGGTFTITNVGMLGVTLNTPIINTPESAILGVGAIVKRPVVLNDQITIRSMTYLCLTYDHRVIDGAPAIRFLQKVKQLLENTHKLLQNKNRCQ